MKRIQKANGYFLIILIYEILGALILGALFKALRISDIRVMLLINHTVIFIIPGIIYLILSKRPIKEILRLNKLNKKSLGIIVLISFLIQPVMSFLSLISTFFFNNDVAEMINEISSTNYASLLLLVAVLPAISEELTIRGIILSGYDKKNKYIASIVTGLFFGIFHLNPQQFLYTFALGFILALVVRITNSIFASVLMHFIINGTSVTLTKVLYLIQNSSIIEGVQENQEYNMINTPIFDKLIGAFYWAAIALAFGIIVYSLIKKLEKVNPKLKNEYQTNNNVNYNVQGNYNLGAYRTEYLELEEQEEKIVNIPFVLSILVFITYMIIFT
ncbi:type II CAAX endopeptidase family protein [Clostridium sp.]|uniref:CPBP family intramembrane glutamic endopeptidase n=1 Tax=Clostridium sp. TaxID=1506 RepID=UPI00260D8C91|nr:type II CAAX endopeptidase family protein [Clostridium sp.]